MKTLDSPEKFILDGVSVIAVTGTLMDILPAVAAVFTIVWTGVRIYETETIQNLIEKLRKKGQ